jgi:hypothetical protein
MFYENWELLSRSLLVAADYLERCFGRSTFAQDQGKPEALSGWRVCARDETSMLAVKAKLHLARFPTWSR